MLQHKDHFHGSDLEKIEAIYHIKKEEITSFSANINPLGISWQLKNALADNLEAITGYPDREYKELRKSIAHYTDSQPEHITVGNGSTELISLFIQTQHPKKAMVLGPTYSEYEREIALGGGTTNYFPLKEADDFRLDVEAFCQALNDSLDLLVLCNPNNPTSTGINRDGMRKILDTCMTHGIFVMVDETYAEFAPEAERITAIPLTNYYTNLIILRGTSKFFAAPGLRLGYAVCGNRDVLKEMNTRQNPWSINSLAEIAGRLMFQDQDYIHETITLIDEERRRLYELLKGWDTVKVYKPSANFLLVQIKKEGVTSADLFDHCIRRKLMIRDCSTFPFLGEKYVRFCIMRPEQNDQLMNAFRELL